MLIFFILLMKSETLELLLECAKFHEDQRNINYTKTQGLFWSKFIGTKFAVKLLRTLLPNKSVTTSC